MSSTVGLYNEDHKEVYLVSFEFVEIFQVRKDLKIVHVQKQLVAE